MTLRAGPHTGGSDPRRVVTVQAPADPNAYKPPKSGKGPGTVAVHFPADQHGNIDPTEPPSVKPDPHLNNHANEDKGKTAAYDPKHPEVIKRAILRREAKKRAIREIISELVEREFGAAALFGRSVDFGYVY